jgi:hypothetical protein
MNAVKSLTLALNLMFMLVGIAFFVVGLVQNNVSYVVIGIVQFGFQSFLFFIVLPERKEGENTP